MDLQEIKSQLDRIERLSALAAKNVLNIDDVAILTGMSKGYIYQLTHKRIIPFYKPTGKQMYFDRSEIEAWMKRNRVMTDQEAMSIAASYTLRSKIDERNSKKRASMKTYIIGLTNTRNCYKIGRTTDIDERLKALKTGNPFVKLIAIHDGDIENQVHSRCALSRIDLEWYEMTDRMLDNICKEFNFRKVI